MEPLTRAACKGADIALFDAHSFPDAIEGLAYCQTCEIPSHCLAVVDPQRSKFDGIAGGKVWRNGHRVRPKDNSTREERALLKALTQDLTVDPRP